MAPQQLHDALETMLSPHGFAMYCYDGPNPAAMGAWIVELRSPEFTVTAGQDRTGDVAHICVGLREDSSKRKRRIGRQPLCRIRGFLENDKSNVTFVDVESQLDWLGCSLARVLDATMFNSTDFRNWVVADARRMFKQ